MQYVSAAGLRGRPDEITSTLNRSFQRGRLSVQCSPKGRSFPSDNLYCALLVELVFNSVQEYAACRE